MPRKSVVEISPKAGTASEKIKCYTDFTSLVNGIVPVQYKHLTDAVCIIPNIRMIDKGTIKLDDYIAIIERIADSVHSV